MRILKYLGIPALVLLLAAAAAPFLIDVNQFRPHLEAGMSEAVGRPVTLGKLSVALLSGGITADGLSVADDPAFSRAPFLGAKSIHVDVELKPLILSRQLKVTAFTVRQPEIALLQAASGEWNVTSLGGKTKGSATPAHAVGAVSDLSVNLMKISGGRFAIGQPGRTKPVVLEDVNLELREFSPAQTFPFSMTAKVAGGGSLAIEGEAGPLGTADSTLTPLTAHVKLKGVDLAGSGLVAPATGFAGLVSLEGTCRSNGRVVSLNGHLKGEKLKLAKAGHSARRPVEFDFTAEHDLRRRAGVLKRGNLRFGSAPATLTGSYAMGGESAVLKLAFKGAAMAVPELTEILPALDIVLPSGSSLKGGTADANVTFEGPASNLVTAGTVALRSTTLVGFNLGSKLSAIEKLAGIRGGPNTEIRSFSANLRVWSGGTVVEDLQLVVPAMGNLNGAGTVSPAHALDFKMRATVHTSGAVMAALGQKGDTTIPFTIAGTSDAPVFRPDMRSIASEKLKGLTSGDGGKKATGLLEGLFGRKKAQ